MDSIEFNSTIRFDSILHFAWPNPTMFAGAFTRGKSAAIQTFGTDAQKVLVSLLFEDRVQIISTFDMNKVASLTYSDDVRDELFDVFR